MFGIIQYKNMVDKSRTLNYNIKADVPGKRERGRQPSEVLYETESA